MSTKRRVLKTRENTQTLLSTLAEKEYCPVKNKYTANIYPKVTAFRPKWGGLRRGTNLNKSLTTSLERRWGQIFSDWKYLYQLGREWGQIFSDWKYLYQLRRGCKLCYP